MKHTLSFEREEVENDVISLTPCIDGERLSDIVERFERDRGYTDPAGGYGGLIPANYQFGPLKEYFLGMLGVWEGYVPPTYFLGCGGCGEVGCWPIVGSIGIDASEVVWSRLSNPFRPSRYYSELGPFRFERRAYLAAVMGLEDVWGD